MPHPAGRRWRCLRLQAGKARSRSGVFAGMRDQVGPLVELRALGEPLRAVDRARLVGDEQLRLDPVQTPGVLAEQLGLDVGGHAACGHVAHGRPRVGPVVVVGVRGPDPDVLEVLPLAEHADLVGLEADHALLVERLGREPVSACARRSLAYSWKSRSQVSRV